MYKDKENRKQTNKFKGNFVHRKTKQVIKYINNLRKQRYNRKKKSIRPSTPDLVQIPKNIPQPIIPDLIQAAKVLPQSTPASVQVTENVTCPIIPISVPVLLALPQLPIGLHQPTSSLVLITESVPRPQEIWSKEVVLQPSSALIQVPGSVTQPSTVLDRVLKVLSQPSSTLIQLPAGLVQPTSSLVEMTENVPRPQEVWSKEVVLQPSSALIQVPGSVAQPSTVLDRVLKALPQPTSTLIQLPAGLVQPTTSSLVEITENVPRPQEVYSKEVLPQPSSALIQVPGSVTQPGIFSDQVLKALPQSTSTLSQLPAGLPQQISRLDGITRRVPKPQKVCFKENILGINQSHHMVSIKNVVEYETVLRHTQEFRNILMLFPESMFIKKIEKIQNPYLKRSFDLRREFHYNNIEPKVLFHGTKYEYLDEICTYNFDWRYSGLERGHRYGRGVNFTLDPDFAANFCNPFSPRKVIVVADVLVMKDRTGRKDMNVPPEGYDTATRANKRTFVKFDDCEFLPNYVVTFDWNRYHYKYQDRLRTILWKLFF